MYGQQMNQYGYQPQGYPQQGYGQQAAPRQPRMNASQMLDQIDSQTSKSVKFQQPGDTVSGIIESVTAGQVHVYDSINQRPTNQPDYWQDGSPKVQVIVTIDTGTRDPSVEDDDGRRSVYIKGWGLQKRAWLNAVHAAGLRKSSDVKPGDRFTATFTGYDPNSKNPNNPAKMFEYTIEHQSDVDQAMQPRQTMPQPAYGMPAPQPTPVMPAQPVPTATQSVTAQQTTQILQLKAVGKTPQDIAGMMGLTVEQVLAVGQSSQQGGQQPEPEF